ncbi:MarR family winged helix-turn-helix transcriptional regulator [Desulfovibrio inopinatus]|uniref:MarR family winged helix-turn-helix transcriptional regulator n=1 Tax=Desulfovibrio inopinatus TaxID=102109 RepID=UPI0003FF4BFF|nr:MarR family winged helix-turn-helix transcriptional regulator [Desulfovibrio inopinatus]
MDEAVSAMRRFNRFYTRFLGLLRDTLADSPVTLSEWRFLFEINETPGLTATNLMDRLLLDRGYVSRTLARLQRRGLVDRRESDTDRREKTLWLTSKGCTVMSEVDVSIDQQMIDALGRLDPSGKVRLLQAMNDIELLLSS